MAVLDSAISAVQGNKAAEQAGSGGWIGALVAAIIVIITVAVLGFMAWKKGRELSALLHEKATAEEDAHQAKVDVAIAADEDKRRAALAAAAQAAAELEKLEREFQLLEEDHLEIRTRIDALLSWDDVDSYLGGGSTTI